MKDKLERTKTQTEPVFDALVHPATKFIGPLTRPRSTPVSVKENGPLAVALNPRTKMNAVARRRFCQFRLILETTCQATDEAFFKRLGQRHLPSNLDVPQHRIDFHRPARCEADKPLVAPED